MQETVLYLIYYLLPSLGLIGIFGGIWKSKSYILGGIKFLSHRDETDIGKIDKEIKKIKTLQILLVMFLLFSTPLLTFTTATISDSHIHQDSYWIVGHPVHTDEESVKGENCHAQSWSSTTLTTDPVRRSIKSSFDPGPVIEKMKDEPEYWHTEEVIKQSNLHSVTDIPGRLAVYKLSFKNETGIVMTYTYFTPIPIVRSFGFRVNEEGEAILLNQDTIIFPMNPSDLDLMK